MSEKTCLSTKTTKLNFTKPKPVELVSGTYITPDPHFTRGTGVFTLKTLHMFSVRTLSWEQNTATIVLETSGREIPSIRKQNVRLFQIPPEKSSRKKRKQKRKKKRKLCF